jgi:hypothetical protein
VGLGESGNRFVAVNSAIGIFMATNVMSSGYKALEARGNVVAHSLLDFGPSHAQQIGNNFCDIDALPPPFPSIRD